MADMHTLNTRIKLKYDSYDNWYDKNPVLLSGEVAIATVASNDAEGKPGFQNLPNVVIKVGDGTNPYRDLKFVSALAADVYEWAKGAEKPVYTATEIDGLESYIAGQIQDTDTQYEIKTIDASTYKLGLYSWAKGVDHSTAGTLVSTIDLSAIDTRLDTIEAALGEGGTVADAIADAIAALDMAKVEAGTTERIVSVEQKDGLVTVTKGEMGIANVAGLQAALDAKQATLEFEGTPTADNKVVTKSAMTTAINGAIEGLDKADTAVEKQFVTAVSEDNGIITVSRAALKATDIPVIEQTQVNGLEGALNAKQDALVIADEYNAESNKVATEATVTKAIAGLEGAMHFRGRVEGETLEAALAAAALQNLIAGDVVLWNDYEYVYDGANWLELGNTSLYQLKADAEADHEDLQEQIDVLKRDKQDNLFFEGTYNKDTNKAVTKSAMDDAINTALDALDYTGGEFGSHKFVTKVTEDNGTVAAEYAQPVIADVDGLTERLAGIDTEIGKKQNALQIDGEVSDTNKVMTKSAVDTAITTAIQGLDAGDTAVEGQFVTAVAEEDGLVKVSRGAVTTDHIQQGTKVLVFDCGSSANSDISKQ